MRKVGTGGGEYKVQLVWLKIVITQKQWSIPYLTVVFYLQRHKKDEDNMKEKRMAIRFAQNTGQRSGKSCRTSRGAIIKNHY